MADPKRRRAAGAVPAVALLVAACSGSPGPSGSAASAPASGVDQAAAERYCTDEGGQLVHRRAVWNTNADPSAQLELAGRMTLCEFESGTGDSTTRISVDLVTLSSTEPTLAAIAYLSRVPPTLPKQPSANPADYNCREGLNGSSTFGDGLSGGGWVDDTQPVFKVMNLCVFPDVSAIDAFGILYYSQGTVRGADLAGKLRYQPGNKLPAIFEAH
jgi:putative hemolysin